MKAMSIIGVVLFGLILLTTLFGRFLSVGYIHMGVEISISILGILYGLAFSIIILVKSKKRRAAITDFNEQLIKLAELKEKGHLTENEFHTKKAQLLKL